MSCSLLEQMRILLGLDTFDPDTMCLFYQVILSNCYSFVWALRSTLKRMVFCVLLLVRKQSTLSFGEAMLKLVECCSILKQNFISGYRTVS